MQILIGVDNNDELVFYDTIDGDHFTCRLQDSDIDLTEWYQSCYDGCGDDVILDVCRRFNCGPDDIGETIYEQFGNGDYIESNCSQCNEYEVLDEDNRCVYWIEDSSSGSVTDINEFKFLVSRKLYDMVFGDNSEDFTRDEIEEFYSVFNRDQIILFCVKEGIITV